MEDETEIYDFETWRLRDTKDKHSEDIIFDSEFCNSEEKIIDGKAMWALGYL